MSRPDALATLNPRPLNPRLLALLFLALLAPLLQACEPEILRNTYFCGPDSLCPPELTCQVGSDETFSYSCALPQEAREFSCAVPSADEEPDDTAEEARDIGEVVCGAQYQFENWGCIDSGSDIDTFRFERPTDCTGSDPRAKLTLRFPIGTAPLTMKLLDASGQVLSTGTLCSSGDENGGIERVCIEQRNLPPGTYDVQVTMDPAANADCGGNCQFNRYQLVIASPVS